MRRHQGSLPLCSPISRDYGDDSYPSSDPRVRNSFFHIRLPLWSPAPTGFLRAGEMHVTSLLPSRRHRGSHYSRSRHRVSLTSEGEVTAIAITVGSRRTAGRRFSRFRAREQSRLFRSGCGVWLTIPFTVVPLLFLWQLGICGTPARGTISTGDATLMGMHSGVLESLSPGHYREKEHGEEHKRHHHGQHEIFIAPRGHEEGRHHGGAQGHSQGE